MTPEIAVIVATAARRERAAQLWQALETIRSQEGVRAVPVVVANGPSRDPQVMARLEGDRTIRLLSLDEGNYPGALHAGRACVDTEWFSQLDDDDLLLPGALLARWSAGNADPRCDAVISNGWSRDHDGDTLRLSNLHEIRGDPLRALCSGNWLGPGAALFRAASVTAQVIAGMPKYLEWTYLACYLSLRCRLLFLDAPSYLYQSGTVASLSGSDAYLLGQACAIAAICRLELPADVRDVFLRRLSVGQQMAALRLLERGQVRQAWQWYLRAVFGKGGYRHLGAVHRMLRGSLGAGPR
ncbi:MAG: hypothetical protein KJZ83_00560 [Burkholderiaceae bacterium]|nr:hypothetical protein [Burkholderiaceae bacterium]